MDPVAALAQAYDLAHGVMSNVAPDQWTVQSPCTEWDAKGVVNHLIGGAKMVTAGLTGEDLDMASLAADHAGDDPAAAYRAATSAAIAAFQADPSVLGRMVKLPFGEMPGAAVAGIFTNDNFGHTWDIAKATGQSTDIAPEFAAEILDRVKGFIKPEFRVPGMFGPEQTAPEGSSVADQVAAFLGRTV